MESVRCVPETLSLGRMAARLGVTRAWLRDQAVAGNVPGLLAGDRWLFLPDLVVPAITAMASRIYTSEGKIIDGRNRLRACQELGIEPSIADLDDHHDPVAYVLSHNLHRRHLTTSQRSMVAENVAKLKRGDNQHKNEDSSIDLSSQQEAASLLNVSVPSVKRARIVKSKGTPELAQMVLDGKVSVDAASRVATKPTAEQETIVSQGPAAVKEAAKTVPKKVAKGSAVIPEVKSYLTGFMEFWNQCDEIGKKAIYVWLQDNYKS